MQHINRILASKLKSDRNLLLRELKEQFGQERFDKLGEFVLDYVAQRLILNPPLVPPLII